MSVSSSTGRPVALDREQHTLRGPQTGIVNGQEVEIEYLTDEIEFSPDRRIWERQPQETDTDWAMFTAWRDLDPHERTYANAYRVLHELSRDAETIREVSRKFSPLAKKYRWRERVNAYDNYVDGKIREQLEARRVRARLETANLGRSMREKAYEAVKALKSIVMVEEDGKLVPRSSLSPSDITKLAKVGRELESYALEDGLLPGGMAVGIQINIGDRELRDRAREILEVQSDVEETTKQIIDITPVRKDGNS